MGGEEGRDDDDGSFGGVGGVGGVFLTQPLCTMQGRGDQGKYDEDGQLSEHVLP
jgi:hypothetical protein